MKKLLLCFAFATTVTTSAMQQTPKAVELPMEFSETWDFAVKANLRRLKLIAKEIKQIAPAYAVIRHERELLVHAQDTRENILRNFRGMPWFSAQSLAPAEILYSPGTE